MRALLAHLFMSRGTLLIQQGDEMGRTQQGNNNAYAQDNEITWIDWARADSSSSTSSRRCKASARRTRRSAMTASLTGQLRGGKTRRGVAPS